MTKTEKKQLAQDLIMHQVSIVGYGEFYEQYVQKIGDAEEADKILLEQMSRVAKLFGFENAWFA